MTNAAQTNASFQLILVTTKDLIQEKGCRHTTLQDIIARSGLSKGAIYHYVSGKDELFGLILKAQIEQVNARFYDVVSKQGASGLANPLNLLADVLVRFSGHQDVSNKIFIYLLGQMDNPKVAALMQEVYQFTVDTSKKWIEFGQQHNVIPGTVPAEKMALTFITFMYGLRVQSTITQEEGNLDTQDIYHVMFRLLQGGTTPPSP